MTSSTLVKFNSLIITGIPVVAQSENAFVFCRLFFFSSATNWKNCAIVPSGQWALNTMTTNYDPRCSQADHACHLDDD